MEFLFEYGVIDMIVDCCEMCDKFVDVFGLLMKVLCVV